MKLNIEAILKSLKRSPFYLKDFKPVNKNLKENENKKTINGGNKDDI